MVIIIKGFNLLLGSALVPKNKYPLIIKTIPEVFILWGVSIRGKGLSNISTINLISTIIHLQLPCLGGKTGHFSNGKFNATLHRPRREANQAAAAYGCEERTKRLGIVWGWSLVVQVVQPGVTCHLRNYAAKVALRIL